MNALLSDNSSFDTDSLESPAAALDAGMGPILAFVTRSSEKRSLSHAEPIHAGDLTARLMTADLFEVVEDVLAASSAMGCQPVLLKGCSTALRYYPEPHLRTMGDVDLLVAPAELPALESQLRSMGFRQKRTAPVDYDRHHHSTPFWHPQRRIWVEAHTRLFPPHSPLDHDDRFSLGTVGMMLSPFDVGKQRAMVMNHELQLVYTSARWSERLNGPRGAFSLLDVALLVRSQSASLDWDHVCAMVAGSWAATAVHLMLGYLARWQLATVPPQVLRRLASSDPFTDRLLMAAMHRLVTMFVVGGRDPGAILTSRNLRIIWSTLVAPRPPWVKLLMLPVEIAFPPDEEDRFDLSRVVRRMRSIGRSASK